MSVRQGGPGFPFLHPHVYMYLCTNVWSPVPVNVEDLPQQSLKVLIDEVCCMFIMVLVCVNTLSYSIDKRSGGLHLLLSIVASSCHNI